MRIGEFAEKFDVKKSTVRYYTDIKLLYPKLTNVGYIYDATCEEDMKAIMDYKDLGFAIEDIKGIISYKRFVKVFVEDELDRVVRLLDTKKDDLYNELSSIQNKIVRIEEHKQELLKIENLKSTGLSPDALNILCCPTCDSSIRFVNSEITAEGIVKGELYCDNCGKIGRIVDGIINTRTSGDLVIIESDYAKKREHWQEVCEMLGSLEIMFKEDKEFWSKGEVFLFNGVDIELITTSLIDEGTNNTYIITEKSMDILKKLKLKFDSDEVSYNIIYICIEDNIPIRPIADRVVDLFGMNMNGLYEGELITNIDAIKKGFKQGFEYMGAYISVDDKLKWLERYNMEFFYEKEILRHLKGCGIDYRDIIPVDNNVPFNEYMAVEPHGENRCNIKFIRGNGVWK